MCPQTNNIPIINMSEQKDKIEIATSTFNEMTYPFLAGLLDGDGHIVVYKNTGEYVITMHIEDEPLVQRIW